MNTKAFCSWSGGKDCALALYRYRQANPGIETHLLTMVSDETGFTYGHGLDAAILGRQAEAMGLTIHLGMAGATTYASAWDAQLRDLRGQGCALGIFGDIDLQEHYDWLTKTTAAAGLEALFPLWRQDRNQLVQEIIAVGFKAKITAINLRFISDKSLLGRNLDQDMVKFLTKQGIDPSAEGGEFHTIVYDGPLFAKALELRVRATREIKGHLINIYED